MNYSTGNNVPTEKEAILQAMTALSRKKKISKPSMDPLNQTVSSHGNGS
jgi:hypothetical protein